MKVYFDFFLREDELEQELYLVSSAKGVDDLLSPNRNEVVPEEGFIIKKSYLVSAVSSKV
jgi:hypothetical protein